MAHDVDKDIKYLIRLAEGFLAAGKANEAGKYADLAVQLIRERGIACGSEYWGEDLDDCSPDATGKVLFSGARPSVVWFDEMTESNQPAETTADKGIKTTIKHLDGTTDDVHLGPGWEVRFGQEPRPISSAEMRERLKADADPKPDMRRSPIDFHKWYTRQVAKADSDDV